MSKILQSARNNPQIWRKEVTCTGDGWTQKKNFPPCYILLEITVFDIRKRIRYKNKKAVVTYGFICPSCRCFTEIQKNEIPDNIKAFAKKYDKFESDFLINSKLH